MKCIKQKVTEKITRVPDHIAHAAVKNDTHVYVPKSEWKAAGRPK